MDIGLWVIQVLLALAFGAHGWTLLFRVERARALYPWSRDVSRSLLRFIGVAELLGALGLILPGLTRILPWLTPLAGAGFLTLMVLAIVFHVNRREWPNAIFNLVLGTLALLVAYGRSAVVPFA